MTGFVDKSLTLEQNWRKRLTMVIGLCSIAFLLGIPCVTQVVNRGTAPTRSRRRNDDRNVGNLARLQSKSLRSKSESGSGVGAQTGVKRCRLLLLGVRKQPLSFLLPFGLGRTPCVVLGCALAWCRAWCSSRCTV